MIPLKRQANSLKLNSLKIFNIIWSIWMLIKKRERKDFRSTCHLMIHVRVQYRPRVVS